MLHLSVAKGPNINHQSLESAGLEQYVRGSEFASGSMSACQAYT